MPIMRSHQPLITTLSFALLLRLGWLWIFAATPPWLDEAEYLQIAQLVRLGGYLDNGAWVRPPLYPFWLALSLGPTNSTLVAQWVHIGLGLLLVALIYRIAWVWWAKREVALVAGFLATCYAPLIAYSVYLMAETLLLVWLAWLLLILLRVRDPGNADAPPTDTPKAVDRHDKPVPAPLDWYRSPSLRQAMLAGAVLGLAALTKPVALAFLPVVMVTFFVGVKRQRFIHSGVLLLCCGAVIAPWTLRNAVVYQRVLLVDSTGGFNLWFGNQYGAYSTGLVARMQRDYPNLADRDRAYRELAYATMARDPRATLVGIGAKFFTFWRTETDILLSHTYGQTLQQCVDAYPDDNLGLLPSSDVPQLLAQVRGRCWQGQLGLLGDPIYLLLLTSALVACMALPRRSRLLVVAWIVPLYLVAALTVVQPRLRMPILPLLLPLSAYGIVLTWQWLRQSPPRPNPTKRQLVVGMLSVALVIWVTQLVPLVVSQFLQWQGQQAWRNGAPTAALSAFEAAAVWYPTRISVQVGAGQLREALGDPAQALAHYQAVTARIPYEPWAETGIARIRYQRGDTAGAKEALRQTLQRASINELAAFAAPIIPTQPALELGSSADPGLGYLLGFYQEGAEGSGSAFRWTADRAWLRFGTAPIDEHIIRLRLSGMRRPNLPLAQMGLLINDVPVIQNTTVLPGWRVYHVLVPASSVGQRVEIQSSTWIPADYAEPPAPYRRSVGIALDWALLATLNPQQP